MLKRLRAAWSVLIGRSLAAPVFRLPKPTGVSSLVISKTGPSPEDALLARSLVMDKTGGGYLEIGRTFSGSLTIDKSS